jgi:RNA polymerase sigma-70 factor (ECF subfamily)
MPSPSASPRPDGRPAVASIDELLAGARRRDPEATRRFVLAVAPTILAAVRRVVGAHHPDVEDIAQDAVMQLLDALGGFRNECSAKHFACRIATHRALAARRHAHYREVWTPATAPEDLDQAAGGGSDGADPLTVARRRQAVRAMLDELPPAQAEAVALYFIMGLTADEVAEATGTPVPTVRSRLRLAREALRERIEEGERFAMGPAAAARGES